MISHDQNFKNLIVDYPRQALALFAENEVGQLDDVVRVRLLREEQQKERLGERFRELDVPLLVEWPDGRREAIVFVLEEETDPSRFSIHRLVHYCADLAELYQTERVVPVVIFLHSSSAIPRQLRLGSDHQTYLLFQYLDCELKQLPVEHYWDSDNLVARLNLPNMSWSDDQKLEVYARAVRGLMELEPDRERQLKYVDFIDIYSALDNNEMVDYEKRYPQETRTMAGLRERLLNEGKQQGLEQGLEQGQAKGERTLLIRLLQHRFGELDEATHQRLEAATMADLERWTDNVLEARSLDEVFTRH